MPLDGAAVGRIVGESRTDPLMSDLQTLETLRGSLMLAADGADLPHSVETLLRQSAAALGAVDACCLPWVLTAAEKVAPIA